MVKKALNFKGFTLIEIMVAILIIGILMAVVTVGLIGVRASSRDARRVDDMKNIRAALEMYFNYEHKYPDVLTFGAPLISTNGRKTYMDKIPNNPTPTNDGQCPKNSNYTYQATNGATSYVMNYCLGKKVSDINSGSVQALPDNISNGCIRNCGTRVCGSDGCGGVCGTCSDSAPYCANGVCSATRATPCSDTTAAGKECTDFDEYGSICGGGYLVCKDSDSNCGRVNLVAAPSGCTGSSGNVSTVCNSCIADSSAVNKAWGDTAYTYLYDVVYGLNNFSDGADGTPIKNNSSTYPAAKYCLDLVITINGKTYDDWYLPAAKELAAMVKSSEPFFSYASKLASNAYFNEGTTKDTLTNPAAPHYNAISLINKSVQSRVAGLPATGAYYSSTEDTEIRAYRQLIHTGLQSSNQKTSPSSIRCVRRFD